MYNADQVDRKIGKWKEKGKEKYYVVWHAAKACVGWPYVYSAWGEYCTPAERRKRYRMCPSHTTIKTKCKGFESGICTGCQWYPKEKRVRCFDCRGYTDWCLRQVGIDLYGDTCGVQWNTARNWAAKGLIGNMPKNTLCCLFQMENGKMKHTGLGYNRRTLECSSGVQYFTNRSSKWTHWAIPAGLYAVVPDPEHGPKPTLRIGSTGAYVKECQIDLIQLGYDAGKKGTDGKYGNDTANAVKAFQSEHTDEDGKQLVVDGVVGQKTWWALDHAMEEKAKE